MKSPILFALLLISATLHGLSRAEANTKQHQSSTPAGPRWESRWGAIATDEAKGVFGSSTGSMERDEAKRAALENCEAKGGLHCEIAISYSNSCSAIAVGDKGFHVDWASNEEKAVEVSMKHCSGEDTGCKLCFTSCSPPQLVQ